MSLGGGPASVQWWLKKGVNRSVSRGAPMGLRWRFGFLGDDVDGLVVEAQMDWQAKGVVGLRCDRCMWVDKGWVVV